jgi:ribosomal protein S18 acetylase RimI-like enzyme
MLPDPQPATPDMDRVASGLIYLTMHETADYLFGCDNARHALSRLFRMKSDRFSYQFTEVVSLSGEIAGLVVSYSGRLIKSLEIPTALRVAQAIGVFGFLRFVRQALPLINVKEAAPDEYYISNIAVLLDQQGQGLGSHMLHWIEKKALKQGFDKISLTVDIENERAFSLYCRTGFNVVETTRVESLRRRIGYGGFYRMVKTLD